MTVPLPLRDSINYCRQLSWQSGSSFYLPFWLLKRREFEAMCVLYAFFRLSDDLVDDNQQTLSEKTTALANWKTNLRQLIHHEPITAPHPINAALDWLIQEFSLKPTWLVDALTGAERDLSPMKLQSAVELDEYCYEVAGTVGLSCLAIWGTTSPVAQELGIICGRAFQRTNILRDLKEDHERNRYYIPFNEHLPQLVNAMHTQEFSTELTGLIQHYIDITEQYYQHSLELGQHIPSKQGRKMFHGILNIYYELFRTLSKHPQLVLRSRVSVPKSRKLWLTCQAAFK